MCIRTRIHRIPRCHNQSQLRQHGRPETRQIRNWTTPTSVTEVRKFLGFTGYYQYFIKDYSKIARPLLDLTLQTTPWHWDTQQQDAFDTLKQMMCEKPVLRQPNFTKQFFIHMDALAYGVGAILSQQGEYARQTPPRNPDYTPSHTSQLCSHLQSKITTSTSMNS
jgi:hypothetical protein